ncbi:MAG TPA: sigma-54-dependent Fis family transcriptional regulator [Bacteroidetes bacterium]|nr:sigma-54-dependent Fis family transcriptional regulator [Bacteroidales bacterium]HHJ09955.1 sigma-54-dependent Fis family transcriptional regulator [Bacteroidota bacterium]
MQKYEGKIRLKKASAEVFRLQEICEKLSKDIDKNYSVFVGNSYPVKKVKEMIARISETDADVLILGENGTGKKLVAREIHRNSARRDKIFINVDLGGISESLIENELFGFNKGAFNDAYKDKPGKLELASGGTIFLDEIGNLSLPLQVKLLSVLENRRITRTGSAIEIPVDIRLICATNRNLYRMVNERRFREDLLYRINMVEIHVPLLKERKDDIPLLINHYMEVFKQKYHKPKLRISQNTMGRLKNYPWPGNVRELSNAVERAIILGNSGQLSPSSLFVPGYAVSETQSEDSFDLDKNEKQLILKAINHNRGNITNAARDLGIARAALYRRMKKHGI